MHSQFFIYVFVDLCIYLPTVYGHPWSPEEGIRRLGAELEAAVSCPTRMRIKLVSSVEQQKP